MLDELRPILDRHDDYTEDDFNRAALALSTNQFLFADNVRDKKHYMLIASAINYYKKLFKAMRRELVFNLDFGYVGYVPMDGEGSLNLKKDESMFLLLIRMIYEEQFAQLNIDNRGSIHIDSNEIVNLFTAVTRFDKPKYTDFKRIMVMFKRHGLLDFDELENDNGNFRVKIRPTIRFVTNEGFVRQYEEFAASYNKKFALEYDSDQETEEGDNGE